MHVFEGNLKQFDHEHMNDLNRSRFQEQACEIGVLFTVATGFTIPISTTLTSILSVGVFICWLVSGQYLVSYALLKKYRVMTASVMLIGFLAIGVLYTPESFPVAFRNFFKYRQFLLIPIYASFFIDPRMRRRGIQLFELAMVITLIGSFVCWWGSFEGSNRLLDRSIFKSRITQNILMAFLVYLSVWKFLEKPRQRWPYALLALITTFNIIAVVPGRSGYLALGILVFVLMYQKLGYKGLVPAFLSVGAVGLLAYTQSETFERRINQVVSEIKEYRTSQFRRSGVNLRIEFYENSLTLAKSNPLFGSGTGSFTSKYHQLVHANGQIPTSNPHNEYVMLLVQNGLIGVGLFLYFFWASWRSTRYLTGLDRSLMEGVIAVYLVGCMVNSLMLDTTEGALFGFLLGLTLAGGIPSVLQQNESTADEASSESESQPAVREAA